MNPLLWLFWILLTEQNGTVFHITFHSMPCCFPLLKHIIVIYNFLRSLFVLFFSKHIFSAWTDMCGAVCASLCPGLNYKTYKKFPLLFNSMNNLRKNIYFCSLSLRRWSRLMLFLPYLVRYAQIFFIIITINITFI